MDFQRMWFNLKKELYQARKDGTGSFDKALDVMTKVERESIGTYDTPPLQGKPKDDQYTKGGTSMPSPNEGEERGSFISRCMSDLDDEEEWTDRPRDEKLRHCYQLWYGEETGETEPTSE